MAVERRFLTGAREADVDEPGLVIEDGGTVQLVAPGGARSALASNGGSLPSQWTVDEFGAVVFAVEQAPDGRYALDIDVTPFDTGGGVFVAAALTANGTMQVDLRDTNLASPPLALYVSGLDAGPGTGILIQADAGVSGGNLPDIRLTDPSSPGEANFSYGIQSKIASSFDPPAGQAIFLLQLGSGSYSGDIFHCRDGNGNLVFQVKSDGSVHIPAGKSVVADL